MEGGVEGRDQIEQGLPGDRVAELQVGRLAGLVLVPRQTLAVLSHGRGAGRQGVQAGRAVIRREPLVQLLVSPGHLAAVALHPALDAAVARLYAQGSVQGLEPGALQQLHGCLAVVLVNYYYNTIL